MKDYRLYETEDFVMDDDFIRWVQDGDQADERFWDTWLARNPSKHLMIAEAKQIVESMWLEQKIVAPEEANREIARVLQIIKEQDGRGREAPRHSTMQWKQWLAAAVFFPMVIAGILLIRDGKQGKASTSGYAAVTSSSSFTEKINGTQKEMSLVLPDGSSARLSAGSRITYANHFDSGNTRDIYLSGEASFKVAGNPRRPFRVFTNELVTKVLGTSFAVRSFEKDTTISVTVTTGKVSVSGIIVACNQRLVYQRPGQKFQKTLVESPAFIVPDTLNKDMSCEDKPVEEVFAQLSKYYGITIVYDSGLMSKCTVTADLTNESFYRKLDLICNAIGATYEQVDGQVVIQSYGCQ